MADIVFPGETGTVLNSASLPANHDLVIYKGDYVEIFVTVKDASGVPVTLTGSSPKAQLKSDYSDMMPIDFTATLTGTPGEVSLVLSSAVTSTLLPGSYIWDFQVTSATGQTRTYIAGDVTVINEVTE